MKNLSFIINLAIVIGISVEPVLILFGKLSADQLRYRAGYRVWAGNMQR